MSEVISSYEKFKIKITGYIERKKIKCWFLHDWTKWIIYKRVSVWEHDYDKYPIRYEIVQEKHCLNCGKLKFRKLDAY